MLEAIVTFLSMSALGSFLISAEVIKKANTHTRLKPMHIRGIGGGLLILMILIILLFPNYRYLGVLLVIIIGSTIVFNIVSIIYALYIIIKNRTGKYIDIIAPFLSIILFFTIAFISTIRKIDEYHILLEFNGDDSLFIKTLIIILILGIATLSVALLGFYYLKYLDEKSNLLRKINSFYDHNYLPIHVVVFTIGVFIAFIYFANYNIEAIDNDEYTSKYYAIIAFWHILTASIFIPGIISLIKNYPKSRLKMTPQEKHENDRIEDIRSKFIVVKEAKRKKYIRKEVNK